MSYTHAHTNKHDILFNSEKGGHPATCNNIDGPWEYHAERVSPREEDKYCIVSFICGIQKAKFIKKKKGKMRVTKGLCGWGIGHVLFKGKHLQVVIKS